MTPGRVSLMPAYQLIMIQKQDKKNLVLLHCLKVALVFFSITLTACSQIPVFEDRPNLSKQADRTQISNQHRWQAPSSSIPSPTASISGRSLIETASTQIGKPYRWGGEAPQTGFDCSGFVWWVYRKNGMQIPRTTRAQHKYGIKVKSLKKADLVFFSMAWPGKNLHVGLYAGEARFIHSPKNDGAVRIDSMLSPYWRKRFIGARRIIKE